MSELYDVTANRIISPYVQVEAEDDVTQIVSKSLDGTVYLQIIGSAAVSYQGTVYVDRAGKAALQAARAGGHLLRSTVGHGVYYGRLTALKFGPRQAGDTFVATVTLAKETAL